MWLVPALIAVFLLWLYLRKCPQTTSANLRHSDDMWLTPSSLSSLSSFCGSPSPLEGILDDIESVSDIIDGVYWTFVEPYEDIVSFVRCVYAE
jgi:hypothetical protein